jgi:hypothetical protein
VNTEKEEVSCVERYRKVRGRRREREEKGEG